MQQAQSLMYPEVRSLPIRTLWGKTNWSQPGWEGSHEVTHTPSAQTGGGQSCPNLSSMKRISPGKEVLVPAGLGVARGWKEQRLTKDRTHPAASRPENVAEGGKNNIFLGAGRWLRELEHVLSMQEPHVQIPDGF